MTRVLVTGATGFIGRALCPMLQARGFTVRAASRDDVKPLPANVERVTVGAIGAATDWARALDGVDAVVHLAALVHVMRPGPGDADRFIAVNAEGTRALARAAADAGIKRFVYMSSVKAAGESTTGRGPLSEDEAPAPKDDYGRSKMMAENILRALGETTALEPVILRPPLVYGPGAAGNVKRLIGLLRRGLPLPLASIQNRRSLVGVTNLCDAVCTALAHPQAAGETFFVSDGEDVSTPGLVAVLARALGRTPRLWPAPPAFLRLILGLLGRRAEAERLLGSLQVSSEKIRRRLGWQAPETLAAGLAATVRATDQGN